MFRCYTREREMTIEKPKRMAIIGIGNYLMGDEGAGIHAIEKLRESKWPENVELMDGGTAGVGLIHLIKGREVAIIIDCADFGGAPGEVRVFDPDDLKRDEKREAGLHATDILTVLEFARANGNYPQKVVIIGIQPGKIEMGMKLSKEVEAAIGGIEGLVLKNIDYLSCNSGFMWHV